MHAVDGHGRIARWEAKDVESAERLRDLTARLRGEYDGGALEERQTCAIAPWARKSALRRTLKSRASAGLARSGAGIAGWGRTDD